MTLAFLFWYDFVARPYDPTRGQFTGPDQKAEEYYTWNPFTFCGNNPMNRIDPSGMIWEDPKDAERLQNRIYQNQMHNSSILYMR